ncbi:Dienelactone hydrolase endo-1,3,1,4-beta-D-glucanase [Mycena venus]|uniref:Dienelactone hydrolase endo-1,3,1,4-beta-D-glucanase n=1 Tax=Mycena venus TaxID=2733690 RepID=A0A8H7CRG3_9AGAR|nr:Dienelactone hydrolase endo-1,3,1,4-beta-D-glucanase [Mycena venus]
MSFCKDCIKGVTHEGTPEGKIEHIGGIETYVATPTVDYPKDKVVLVLTDVFGLSLVNNKLLTDDYARNGFKAVAPDLFNGDPVTPDAFSPGSTFDIGAWFAKGHDQAHTRPIVDKVIAALKAEGVTTFAAVGYCFGARYVFDLAFENIIKASAVAHPSLLKVPEDLERYVAESKAPLLINSCTVDQQYPPESQAKGDEIFANFAPGYKREYFDGCSHGFAVRGDLSDPKVKAGKEGAFKATVEWFINTISAEATKNRLRGLLRETAQPVAVVTSVLSPDASTHPHDPTEQQPRVYHGATLSSFTSIAMDPVPLVTFALRIPSRMAASLNSSPSNSSSDMVINILSAHQASIATSFSRPDLHPHPFSTTPYFLNADGLPVIRGSLGAIACKLVAKGLPLHDLRFLRPQQHRQNDEDEAAEKVSGTANVSELFIAQVTRVEELDVPGDEGHDLPLLYHRRRFTTCIPGDISTAGPS